MKTKITTNPHLKYVHHVEYRKIGDTMTHKPFPNKKGIHCEGDKFGYIVDWQISEKKKDIIFAK